MMNLILKIPIFSLEQKKLTVKLRTKSKTRGRQWTMPLEEGLFSMSILKMAFRGEEICNDLKQQAD